MAASGGARQLNVPVPVGLYDQLVEMARQGCRPLKDEALLALLRHAAAPPADGGEALLAAAGVGSVGTRRSGRRAKKNEERT